MARDADKPYRYKAFISYNHRDKKFAKTLHRQLENYSSLGEGTGTNKKPLYPIFLDENELRAGTTLSEAIQDALKASECLIVICSENSITSQWVKAEISLMRSLHHNPKIIGVLPNKLGDETHIDALFGAGSEHLAADFRAGNNKYLQLSKIAATMSDVDLDVLYKRETRRKNKQMLFMGSGLTAVAILMSGLAFNAHIAEAEAVRQRQQSEEVIAFMVDEFRDDLESLDRLDILDDIGQKAEAYFEDRDLNNLSDESILLQSRTLRQLSDVDERRGEFKTAKTRILSAHKASQHMMDKRPEDRSVILEHAKNTDHWVYLAYQTGDLVKALKLSHEVLDIYDQGIRTYVNDEDLMWKRALAQQNVGIMLLQSGKANEGKPYLEQTLNAVRAENEKRDLTENELYDYVNIYTWYIRALPDDTPLSFLYNVRQEQVGLLEDMNKSGARSIRNQSETLNVQRAAVKLLLDMGRDAEAEDLMLTVQNAYAELLAHDAENIGWRRHIMRSKLTLARVRDKRGNIASRNALLTEVKALHLKPNGEKWLATSDITLAINRLDARKLYEQGKSAAAIEKLGRDAANIQESMKAILRPRDKYQMASLNTLKAEFLIAQHKTAEAHETCRNVLTLLSDKNSYTIAEQKLQLTAYERLGETQTAQALRAKLETRGIVLRN